MKNKIFSLLLISIVLLSGCKDFFNISNPQTLNTDNFPTSMKQVDLLVTAAYAQDHGFGLYAFYWFPMGIYLYDHTSDLYGSYDERAASMDNYSNTDSRYLTQTYTDITKWIKLSTVGLEGIESYRRNYANTNEKEALNYAEAECRFNRALAYWHAQIFFEINPDALGFPIIDQVAVDAENLKISRATVRETWKFAIEDLEQAIPYLIGHNDPYRASEWAGKALLAKMYMQSLYIFPENKEKAKAVMEDIINNSGKHLVSTDIYKDMFYGNLENEHNAESLYELTMTNNPNQDGPWEGYTTGSGMPTVYAPWYVDLDISNQTTNPLEQEHDVIVSKKASNWANNHIHDLNIARFGFADFHGDTVPRWTLNPDFVDTYADEEGNLKTAERSIDNFPYILADDTYRTEAIALKNDPSKVDPRLMICAGQPYVDQYIDGNGRTTWYDRSSEINNLPERLAWQHRKYTNINGVEMGSAPYGKNQSSDCNIHIIRLADIYLLYAELMQDDNEQLALEYVNKVHRRAYGYDPNSTSPYDYTSLTDRTHAFYNDDPLAYDPIKYERWAELFAEGQWWFDVRRYKIGQQEANYFKETSHGPITWKGDCSYVQPIPQLELERNPKMRQSEGYTGI